jgi:tryptophan 7-halogenase
MPYKARVAPSAIVVVGDGAVGLAAAIALRRALPHTDVSVVTCNADPAALADRAMTTMPKSNAFHERIGLDEKGLITRAGASHRLAIRFVNWASVGQSYDHNYGPFVAACPEWPDTRSVNESLCTAGRFAYPSDDATSPLSDVDYALRYHLPSYHNRLQSLSRHLGVRHYDASFMRSNSDGNSGISYIILTSNEKISGNIFIDCTGPQALLINACRSSHFESWGNMLPCNRMVTAATPGPPALSLCDSVEARNMGWRSKISGRDATYHSFCYNADIADTIDLGEELGCEPGESIAFHPGRLTDSWVGNVVAFGDAAAVFEPLHWCNLTLAHEQILLFLEMVPGGEISPLERVEYNRRSGQMADRVRDYVALHYCGAHNKNEAFWRYTAYLDRSPGLNRTLYEYRKRERLPYFEEEILGRDAWLSAMMCCNITPGTSALAMANMRDNKSHHNKVQQQRSAHAIHLAKPYPDWLKSVLENSI